MPRLSPGELRGRLGLDYRAVAGLSRETLGAIRAYASHADLRRRELGAADGEAGRAAVYVVEYRFPHLVGRGVTATASTAVFDLFAGGAYPFSPPTVAFVTRPLPWSPHVNPSTGTVCLGSGWTSARGQMLLAQLIVHVMRLLNFDEPRRSLDLVWNASADVYWHSVLGRRPFLPELRYPRLPSEITHGISDHSVDIVAADGEFHAAGGNDLHGEDMFRPVEK